MKKTLKQLKAEVDAISKEKIKLLDEIEKIESIKIIPKIKAKYEGKFWVFDNGTCKEDRWPLYSYCHSVIDQREGIFDSFEIRDQGVRELNIRHQSYFFLCEKEITKEEYMKAMIDFQNMAMSLNHWA